jgi:hypothetical protein
VTCARVPPLHDTITAAAAALAAAAANACMLCCQCLPACCVAGARTVAAHGRGGLRADCVGTPADAAAAAARLAIARTGTGTATPPPPAILIPTLPPSHARVRHVVPAARPHSTVLLLPLWCGAVLRGDPSGCASSRGAAMQRPPPPPPPSPRPRRAGGREPHTASCAPTPSGGATSARRQWRAGPRGTPPPSR